MPSIRYQQNVPTIAQFSCEDGFRSVNKPDWWDKRKVTYLPGEEGKIGVTVGALDQKSGYVIDCRIPSGFLYSSIWCPRDGDVAAYMMGPGLKFLSVMMELKRNDVLGDIRNSLTDLYNRMPAG